LHTASCYWSIYYFYLSFNLPFSIYKKIVFKIKSF
jgi:hypothetical protein